MLKEKYRDSGENIAHCLAWTEIRFPRMQVGHQQQTGSNVREMGQLLPYEESFCASTLNPFLWEGLLDLCLNCWISRLELQAETSTAPHS